MKKIKTFLKDIKSSATGPARNDPYDSSGQKYEEFYPLDETWQKDPALGKFLKSKGLDPRYVTRAKMISHAKTGDFEKWKQDHYDKARLTHGLEQYSPGRASSIIKEIYKQLRLEDSEEKPKSSNKPKFEKTDPKDSTGDNKPDALAVLTLGTPMTGPKNPDGTTKDKGIVEIDPSPRGRSEKKGEDKEKKTEDKKSTK